MSERNHSDPAATPQPKKHLRTDAISAGRQAAQLGAIAVGGVIFAVIAAMYTAMFILPEDSNHLGKIFWAAMLAYWAAVGVIAQRIRIRRRRQRPTRRTVRCPRNAS